MKKIEFYTLINNFGKSKAIKVKGYTDGTYNIYKDKYNNWHVVVPTIGIAFPGYFKTRKQAVEDAYSDAMQECYKKYYEMHMHKDSFIERFERLVKESEKVTA